jgi:hypothetical protein
MIQICKERRETGNGKGTGRGEKRKGDERRGNDRETIGRHNASFGFESGEPSVTASAMRNSQSAVSRVLSDRVGSGRS